MFEIGSIWENLWRRVDVITRIIKETERQSLPSEVLSLIVSWPYETYLRMKKQFWDDRKVNARKCPTEALKQDYRISTSPRGQRGEQ